VVTRRLQAERRTRSVRRPKTGVPLTVLRNQPTIASSMTLCCIADHLSIRRCYVFPLASVSLSVPCSLIYTTETVTVGRPQVWCGEVSCHSSSAGSRHQLFIAFPESTCCTGKLTLPPTEYIPSDPSNIITSQLAALVPSAAKHIIIRYTAK